MGLLPDGEKDSEKNTLKPHLKKQWSIPPQANTEFVWRMEDVLEVYTRPYDPRYPQACMDEVSKQLLRDTRQPLPMGREDPSGETTSMSGAGWRTCSCSASRYGAGAGWT